MVRESGRRFRKFLFDNTFRSLRGPKKLPVNPRDGGSSPPGGELRTLEASPWLSIAEFHGYRHRPTTKSLSCMWLNMDERISDSKRRFTEHTTNMSANIVTLLHGRQAIYLDVYFNKISGAAFSDAAFFDRLNAIHV